MRESPVPELLRSPLENVVLKVKRLDMGEPHSVLGLAMDAPKLEDIANTVLILKELGALLKTVNNEYSHVDGDLTFIGRVMEALPIDVRASRLIILGYCYGLLDDCIIMGNIKLQLILQQIKFQNGKLLTFSQFFCFSRLILSCWSDKQKCFQKFV